MDSMTDFTLCTRNLTMVADRTLIDGIHFSARSGEIHGIIGNNGEGKTVFAQVLAGLRPKTSGQIFLDDRELNITCPLSAQKNGIYMLTQEVHIFPELSVRDNLICGNEELIWGKRIFTPSKKEMEQCCQKILDMYHLHFHLWQRAGELEEADLRLLQLLRILICHPKVLILDEFSTFLNYAQTTRIFDILMNLKEQNTAILLITHNYSEIRKYCDQVSIITDGTITANFTKKQFESEEFITHITNLNMNFRYPRLVLSKGKTLLKVEDTDCPLTNICFTLHEREIIGITGLTKPQRKALSTYIVKHLKDVGLLPEKSSDEVLFLTQGIPFNITASNFRKARKKYFVSASKEKRYAKSYITRLGIHNATVHTPTRFLSSGNKQKLLIARSLFNESKLYIYDEPTKNLDSISRLELYNILNALALKDASILILSSDISELIGMCSRIVLFKDGKQIGNYSTDYLSSEALYKQL